MRIGIYGGTFDPVHLGHLLSAEQCREQGRLAQVWFVPAADPPHKKEQRLTPFAQRVEMLGLATAGYEAFRIETLEQELPKPSYTANTLRVLQEKHPEHTFCLLLGSDCLPDLPKWYQPDEILRLAELLVVARPEFPLISADELRRLLHLEKTDPVRIQEIEMPLVSLASREIRARWAEGRSIRYMVPRAVECYVETHGLYRQK